MGKLLDPTGPDIAEKVVGQALAAIGAVSDPFLFTGTANISITLTGGATGTAAVERSFDGGTNWLPLSNLGAAVTFTGPCSEVIFNREAGVPYRVRRLSGAGAGFVVRLSQ